MTVGAVALGASVLAPQAASAAVSCTYHDSGQWVSVQLDADGDQASLAVKSGVQIAVNDVPCGAATVINTDGILVGDVSAGGDTIVEIDLSGGSFAPGWTDEVVDGQIGLGGEIEMLVGLGEGSDTLLVTGSDAGASIVLGSQGINLNAGELGQDADVTLQGGGEHVIVDGGPGSDWLSGHGGAGTGYPYVWPLELHGGAGDDELQDGDRSASEGQLDGGAGNDLLLAGKYADALLGGTGDDTIVGGPGANAIDGGEGADKIDGGEGADRLAGGAGIDAIESRDGSPDSVSCGEGPDSLAVDALDTVAPDCAPPAAGGGDTESGGGDTQAGGGDAQTGGGGPAAPVLAVGVPRQSLRSVRSRGLRVLLTCSAGCRAAGRLVAAPATARRLGLGTSAASRRIGRLAPLDLTGGATSRARIRLGRKARGAMRHARTARLVLRTHAAGQAGQPVAPVRTAVRLRAG